MGLDYSATIKRDNTNPNEKGIKTKVLIAPVDWFTTIAGITAAPAAPGDRVVIDGDHAFDVGKGFITAYTALDSGQLTAELVGDPGGRGFAPKLECFMPGDDKVIAEAMAYFKDDEVIVLVETATDHYIQLGRDGMPAQIDPSFGTGQASAGRNGWTFAVTSYHGRIQYYEGTITLKPAA